MDEVPNPEINTELENVEQEEVSQKTHRIRRFFLIIITTLGLIGGLGGIFLLIKPKVPETPEASEVKQTSPNQTETQDIEEKQVSIFGKKVLIDKLPTINGTSYNFFSLPNVFRPNTVVEYNNNIILVGSGKIVEYNPQDRSFVKVNDVSLINCFYNAVLANNYIYARCSEQPYSVEDGLGQTGTSQYSSEYNKTDTILKIDLRDGVVQKEFTLLDITNYSDQKILIEENQDLLTFIKQESQTEEIIYGIDRTLLDKVPLVYYYLPKENSYYAFAEDGVYIGENYSLPKLLFEGDLSGYPSLSREGIVGGRRINTVHSIEDDNFALLLGGNHAGAGSYYSYIKLIDLRNGEINDYSMDNTNEDEVDDVAAAIIEDGVHNNKLLIDATGGKITITHIDYGDNPIEVMTIDLTTKEAELLITSWDDL